MGWKKIILEGGKVVAKQMAPELANDVAQLGTKLGNEIIDKQMSLVKIPDLKDVLIDEALRILKDELHLTPLPITAKASAAFADERENEVVSSEPRFGSKVNPHSAIKVYFLTQAVIEQSKILSKTQVQEFKCPDVIGLNLYEAREDLEALGLRLSEKLEKPNLAFIDKEDGQVTRLTNPNGQKLSSKLKTGDRVTINYVNDEVIEESLALKSLKEKGKQERFDKFEGAAKNALKGINHGVVEGPQHLAKNIKNPFKKKTDSEVSE